MTAPACRARAVAPVSAKCAVTTLPRSLAAETAPRGLFANSVGPGFIDTDLTRAALAHPAVRAHAEAVSARKRVGTVSDVADVVASLASPGTRWITGRRLDATGGSLLGPHWTAPSRSTPVAQEPPLLDWSTPHERRLTPRVPVEPS
ncbi:SDR family oxidoreductase [Streptomyces sp. NBC_00487]|nr:MULTISPECIES: SDR family oxidoreductase [unclassified Streptomyces]